MNMANTKDAALLKPKKTFTLKLSLPELVHLRDLFSVSLPVDLKETVSQSLASSQGRQLVETKLWNKIVNLCNEGSVPLDDEAPDFIITVTAAPELGVFEIASGGHEEDEPSGLEADDDADGDDE